MSKDLYCGGYLRSDPLYYSFIYVTLSDLVLILLQHNGIVVYKVQGGINSLEGIKQKTFT